MALLRAFNLNHIFNHYKKLLFLIMKFIMQYIFIYFSVFPYQLLFFSDNVFSITLYITPKSKNRFLTMWFITIKVVTSILKFLIKRNSTLLTMEKEYVCSKAISFSCSWRREKTLKAFVNWKRYKRKNARGRWMFYLLTI